MKYYYLLIQIYSDGRRIYFSDYDNFPKILYLYLGLIFGHRSIRCYSDTKVSAFDDNRVVEKDISYDDVFLVKFMQYFEGKPKSFPKDITEKVNKFIFNN